MKRIALLLGKVLAVLIVLLAIFVVVMVVKWPPKHPDTPKPDLAASDDPAVIARGAYLVDAVAHCGACHAKAEEYIGIERGKPQTIAGGHEWHMGPLGTIRSPNVTPHATGIADYTDPELARAIRHGIKKDDTGALFMMSVGPMSDDDLVAIMSYVRSVEPVDRAVADNEIGVMGKVLFQTAMAFFQTPHDYARVAPPFVRESDTPDAGRGKYLAEGPGFCAGCHTEYEIVDDQLGFASPVLSGNATEPFPDDSEEGFEFIAPNLTPHPTSVTAGWTKEQFMTRFRTGRVYAASPMPWETYRNMTDVDLESIWLHLQSLPPHDNDTGPSRRETK